MVTQPRLLHTPPFIQDPWDKANQEKMNEMEAANGLDYQGIYEELQKMREVERKKMVELGLLDEENSAKNLNEAIMFHGTCTDMCPTFERVRRALESNVKALEKDPVTNRITRDRAVKAFSRPAAGQPLPMPSEVRPPQVLKKTLDYLVDNVLPHLPDSHPFLWDRTRSIRQDFIYQNSFGPEAIDCNERIVRIHLLSLHIMAGSNQEYSQQQELEQLNKALQTLTETYQDVRNHGGVCPNEAEFRAYHLISHYRDSDLDIEAESLPDDVFNDRFVQLALKLRTAMSQNNVEERAFTNTVGALDLYVNFFRLVYSDEVPFLFACLLETHFNEFRFHALKSMTRAYHTKSKAFPASAIQRMLGFDSLENLVKYLTYYDFDTFTENGTLMVTFFNGDLDSKYKLHSYSDKPKLSQGYSTQLDAKIKGKPLKSFVNCGKPNNDLQLRGQPEIDKSLPADNGLFVSLPEKSTNASLSLSDFVSGQGNSIFGQSSGFGQTKDFGRSTGFGQKNSGGTQFAEATGLKEGGGLGQTDRFGQMSEPNSFQGFGTTLELATNDGFGSKHDKPSLEKSNLEVTSIVDSQMPGKIGQNASSSHIQRGPEITEQTKSSQGPFGFPKPSESAVEGNAFESKPAQTFSFAPKTEAITDTAPVTALLPIIKSDKSENSTQAPKTVTFDLPEKTEPEPQKRTIMDSQFYDAAIDEVCTDLIRETVKTEVESLVPSLVQEIDRGTAKEDFIASTAKGLFDAFLSEQIHQSLQVVLAERYDRMNLYKKVFSHVRRASKQCHEKEAKRRKRIQELNSVSFGVKRPRDTEPSEKLTRRKPNTSLQDLEQKQLEVEQLWRPLNLKRFAETCSAKVKGRVKCLIVVDDWSLPLSKWLNTKFGLKLSKDKTFYEHEVAANQVAFSFESLPTHMNLEKESLGDTTFVVFESGIVDIQQLQSHENLRKKLERDAQVLKKMVKLCLRISLRRVLIMLLIWDASESGMSMNEITAYLQLHAVQRSDVINDIVICDMSNKNLHVADTLELGFNRLAETFTGALSARGERRLREAEPKPVVDTRRSQSFMAKHALTGNADLSLFIGASYNLLNSRIEARSIASSFASMGAARGSNCSILEESTPFGLPRPKLRQLLQKLIKELQGKTAAIKSRFSK